MQQTFSVEPGKTEDDWYLEKRHSLISDGTLRSENDKVNWLIQITHTGFWRFCLVLVTSGYKFVPKI